MTPRLVIAAAIIAVGVALPQYQEDRHGSLGMGSDGRAVPELSRLHEHLPDERIGPEGGSGEASGASAPLAAPVSTRIGTVLLGGRASWYGARGNIAAAGPALRDFLGPHWRGTLVRVTAGRSVVVRLTDWCRCPHGRLIDLSDDAFRQLAPLSVGVLGVSIARVIELPDTATK